VRARTAYLLDCAAVTLFAAVGRASHGEENPVLGVLITAWPFLVGLTVGWLFTFGRTHAAPLGVRAAVPVWLVTLLGGMAVRALTGRGVAWSFVLVAGAVLALLLLGWRWLEARRTAETAAD
jgi:hypothetical protein